MKIPGAILKLLTVFGSAAAVFAVYLLVERPWFLHWGATPAERAIVFAGDERVRDASEVVTRAVTVQAPVDRVWSWLAQLGQDRAGFYSYDLLENLTGCEMPRATRILPGAQEWGPNDKLWMYPSGKLNGLGGAPLVAYEPSRYLVFATRQIGTSAAAPEDAVWGFHVRPAGPNATRLIARGTAPAAKGALALWIARGAFEPAHFVMERRMLLNLKALAEGRTTSRATEGMTIALWALTLALLVAALVEVARRPRWLRPLGVAVASALAFQVQTFAQPAPAAGAAMVVGLALWLWLPQGRPRERRRALAPGWSPA